MANTHGYNAGKTVLMRNIYLILMRNNQYYNNIKIFDDIVSVSFLRG